MIVENPNFVSGNFPKGLRALSGLGHLLSLGAFDYSAISDCGMLTDYQRSQAPQCGGTAGGASGPAVYIAPPTLAIENCQPPYPGAIADTACVNRNLQTQQNQMQFNLSANRAVFLKNCNDAWMANDVRYAELNMPRPMNDCESKSFGQVVSTPTSNYGIDYGGLIPFSWSDLIKSTDLIPSVAASNSQVSSYQAAVAPKPVAVQTAQQAAAGSAPGGSGSVVDDVKGFLTNPSSGGFDDLIHGEADILGMKIPYWLIGAGVVGGLYVASKGR